MLHLVLAAAMVLSQDNQRADQASKPRVMLDPARVIFVDNVSDLQQQCGMERPIEACTRFVGYGLKASCNGSSLVASARFRYFMIVLARKAMPHELLHISDMRESLEQYVSELEKSYASPGDCEDAAADAVENFPQLMQQFVWASNEKRHVKPRSRRPGDRVARGN